MSTPSPPPNGPASEAAKYEPPKQAPKQNPAFRMLGLPSFRVRLPSRNWLIFLSITGSLAAAITYDRRQKKAAQQKWCDLVAHIAHQPLPVDQMPRKLTVFLSAPPGDGIRPSREYFKEYIKPILVAAAMDYDVIEGRKEGQVRYGTAEQIRRLRRRKGEQGQHPEQEDEMDRENVVEMVREQRKIGPEPSVRGDLVIGRHTWKEYLRGLHEGWLGPLDEPTMLPPPESPAASPEPASPSTDAIDPPSETPADKTPPENKTPSDPSAYIATSAYGSSVPSPNLPIHLEPSSPIPHRHILGFLNTPLRIYRFLNQRHLADSIGRETAAVVLGSHRPYHRHDRSTSPPDDVTTTTQTSPSPQPNQNQQQNQAEQTPTWEQQSLLASEESNWHKSVRKSAKPKPRPKPNQDDDDDDDGQQGDSDPERLWMDEPTLDRRIAERMRRFDLADEEEERARRIGEGLEGGGVADDEKGEGGRSWWWRSWR